MNIVTDETPEAVEAKIHVRIQRAFQKRVRDYFGVTQLEAQNEALTQLLSDAVEQGNAAIKMIGQLHTRLKWHERNSEVLRSSAEKYERHRSSHTDEKPSKILLLNGIAS